MKKMYKKSPDTDQSNQSNIDKQISNLIVTPKNTTVKAINYTVDINLDQFKKHNAELTTTEIDYIKLFANGGTVNILTSDPVQKIIDHLTNLGIFTINSHAVSANVSERGENHAD
ncbi:hypothetical protein [Pediococcus parvulus]|uniref:hypothetical protein n=1 Tax=Pediococcus parvulus TaxID=54062 RepID=UPI0021A8EB9C|nr:hypothetical protein [Pediococcus parvulus]MCT3034848.1 hypothetical protein [Pediococcus parvulus]